MRTWKITFGIEDGDRDTGYMAFWLNSGGVDYITQPEQDPYYYAYAMAQVISPMLSGTIRFIHIFENVPVPGSIPALPAIDSDIEERVRWRFKSAGGELSFTMPAIDETILVNGGAGKVVDLSLPDVAAFIAMMLNPIETPEEWLIAPVDIRGADLISLISAEQYFG